MDPCSASRQVLSPELTTHNTVGHRPPLQGDSAIGGGECAEQLSTLSAPPVKGIPTQQGREGGEEEGFTPTLLCTQDRKSVV